MPPSNQQPNTARRFLWFLLIAALLILVLAGIAWWLQPKAPRPQPAPTTVRQPPPPESPTPAVQPYGTRYYYAGPPRSGRALTVLTNIGYVASYDEDRKDPDWVCYRLFQVNSLRAPPRPKSFQVDTRTRAMVTSRDYTGSGYDRGHCAPNYAIAVCYGQQAQLETFLMSNILPEKPHLNRDVWKNLERLEIRDYAQKFKEIWVVTGPVFDAQSARLRNGIRIPGACYKILVDEEGGQPRLLAFIIPQSVAGQESPGQFLTTVDAIETETGLDFLSDLPDDLENRLEAAQATRMWW